MAKRKGPKEVKGPKVLDSGNPCQSCEKKSGSAVKEVCPLSTVLPPHTEFSCNCCGTCRGKCSDAV